MSEQTPTCWYVMQRMPMAYDEATSALGSIVPVSTVEAVTRGRLSVDSVHHARPGALEAITGSLRCGALPWQWVPVEVGIEPWSREESVVALRPAARPPGVGVGIDRYFDRALSVLDALRQELVAAATPAALPEPVRELPRAS